MKIQHIKGEKRIEEVGKESKAREDTFVCREEGEVRRRKERKDECREREREAERKRGARVKRSWSGYETSSDLI